MAEPHGSECEGPVGVTESLASRLSRLTTVSSSISFLDSPDLFRYNDTVYSRIARSYLFQNATLVAILANAAWIGADTEWNHAHLVRDNRLPLQQECLIVEMGFCIFFASELAVRFLAYERKRACMRDAWFVFDAVLLAFMITENVIGIVDATGTGNSGDSLGNMAVFKLIRLMRLTRVVKLMRFFPDLMTLVRGMFRAMESVFFVLFFLMLITYGTSIVFTSQVGRPPSERPPAGDSEDPTALDMFGDIGSAMMTLFTNGVLGDNLYQTLMAIKEESVVLLWVFIVFVCVSGITLLNMLIGVLCKVVQDTAKREAHRRKAVELRETFCKAFKAVDVSNDGFISEQEWDGIQSHPDVRKALLRLGVEESEIDKRLDQLCAKVFCDRPARRASVASSGGSMSVSRLSKRSTHTSLRDGLDFEAFVEQVSNLQWDKPASALDVATFRCKFECETAFTKKKLDDVEKVMREIMERRGLADAVIVAPSSPTKPRFPTTPLPTPPASPPPRLDNDLLRSTAGEVAVALRPALVEPAPPQPPDTFPPPLTKHHSKQLPPLHVPPSLPPLPEDSPVRGARLPPALPAPPERLPHAPLHRAAVCGTADLGEAPPPVLSLPAAAFAQKQPAAQPPKAVAPVPPPRDRLASVPTEVLLATIKSRGRGPRKETIS